MAKNRRMGYKYTYFGENGFGHTIKAYGNNSGKYLSWNETGDTLDVQGGFKISGQIVSGQRFVVTYPNFAAANIGTPIFTAPAPCKVIAAIEIHKTAASSADTMTLEKVSSGGTPGSGTVVLASNFTLNSAINTPVTVNAATGTNAELATGNTIYSKAVSGSGTGLAGGCLTLILEWL